jgi:hypothetical protein
MNMLKMFSNHSGEVVATKLLVPGNEAASAITVIPTLTAIIFNEDIGQP